MDPLAVGLVALAAVLHVTWNILLKTAGDPLRTATVGIAAASAGLVPLCLVGWLALGRPEVPPLAWGVGIVSGGVEVAYFVFLSAAYRRGDLSVVYPLARGSAPLLAIAFGVVLLGERLPPLGWAGVALLVAGLLAVQQPWRLLRGAATPDRSAAGFALLTGAMIATYSALDRVGVQQAPPWLYAGILWPTCAVGLLAIGVARRPGTGGAGAWAAGALAGVAVPRAVLAGILTLAAYALVLAALSRAPLAAVAPLRESAVLLASTWGVLRLSEGAGRRAIVTRVAGSAAVLVGAAALALGH